MKISKSKQELARIISENGGWRDGSKFSAIEMYEGDVWFCSKKPEYKVGFGIFSFKDFAGIIEGKFNFPNWHQAILSREEYFHLYPAPSADGWIECNGGKCPVSIEDLIDVNFSNGDELFNIDSAWDWVDDAVGCDITSRSLHKPNQANPEFCESVMRSIPEPEAKPTIEQLAADYRNSKDYANRKQQEADDAKADSESKLAGLVAAGKALGISVSPITAKQSHELVIVIQVGDEAERVESNINRDRYNGQTGTVLEVDNSSTPYLVDFGGNAKIWCHEVKFIRRP